MPRLPDLQILGQAIPAGRRVQIELEVAKLPTRARVRIPIIVSRGKKPGPVLLLMAGLHGDEVNGVEIIRRIIRQKLNRPVAGTVICIPVFNVFGFLNQSRTLPDGRDLNRSFPGSATGSLASRFARAFMDEIAPHVEIGIDFHTGGAERFNHPQIRADLNIEENLDLAKAFAAPYSIQAELRSKSIREVMHKKGVPWLIFEGGKALDLDRDVVEAGVSGAQRVMAHLGMHPPLQEEPPETCLLADSRWLRSPHSGMFHPLVPNGSKVSAGEVLGMITDPFGDFERKVKSNSSGHIICINTAPVVTQGDALFHLGFEPVAGEKEV